MISQNKTTVILFVIGIIFLTLGGFRIGSSYFEFDDTLLQIKQDISPTPELKPLHVTIPQDAPSSFEWMNINFYAEDVFAAGFPINYDIHVKIRESNEVANLYLVLREPNDTITWVNSENVIEFLKTENSLGNIIKIPQISPKEFKLSQQRTFPFEHEYGLSILANSKNFGVQAVDLTGEILIIEPSSKKTNINNNRVTILTDSSQLKSNFVIEGFSAIIVGWIPIELGIQLFREKRKETHDKIKAINTIISELLSVQEHYKNKKPIVEIKGKDIVGLHPIMFSEMGLENAIANGMYQEFEDKDREEIGRLYLEFKSLTQLGEQIKNVAFLNSLEKSDKFTHLTNLAESYEKKYDKTNTDISKILPKLYNYVNNLI